ncbi:DUF4188 domain-containing protein [Leptolyngbya sp. AN02str]|uniref:DUF4188 domain-containing protein n=1 Tax=Leptolyngbya sp. AN02str TaxID=3423363 RepID=UPI003D3137FB
MTSPAIATSRPHRSNQVIASRFTANTDEPVVVFLIGIRINSLLAISKWLPTAQAMTPMMKTLYTHPEKGFLGAEQFLYWRGFMLLQYWRSHEDLQRFAHSPSDPHRAAWQRFYQSVGTDGSVGIWHETYSVQPGQMETIYANMPPFGLAKATEVRPATGARSTATGRMQTAHTPHA